MIPPQTKRYALSHLPRFGAQLGFRTKRQYQHNTVGAVHVNVRRATVPRIHVHEQCVARFPILFRGVLSGIRVSRHQLKPVLFAVVFHGTTGAHVAAWADGRGTHLPRGILKRDEYGVRRAERTDILDRGRF